MSSKPKIATRASTRIKSQVAPPPVSRVTRSKAGTSVAPPPTTAAPVKKKIARKPLANRDNETSVDNPENVASAVQETPTKNAKKQPVHLTMDNREPIMAYLRIRPYLGEMEPACLPYLTSLSDTSVCMTDPNQNSPFFGARFRASTLPQSSKYTFSHVFPPVTMQCEFFTKTTLPLVKDVLEGRNALLFAYGVTNSGKTYTVQGGTKEGSAGIVPRTFDVLFNSIEGLHGDGRYRPVRLQDIEQSDSVDMPVPQLSLTEPSLREALAEHLSPTTSEVEVDPTALKVDPNYGYCVWLSYAEIYNEKVYDLLENVKDDSIIPNSGSNLRPVLSSGTHPLRVTRKALQLKSCLRSDSDPSVKYGSGKYIDGLRQFRVQSASQAKAFLKLGQLHRRVFGTLANRESSRSHALVIIKVVRGHRGERDDITSFQVSRLTLVDLAGSERTKQAQTTGDRLKEAGNINKSLMVLGQCLEVLRANQRRLLANAIVEVGKANTREPKKGLALVPFRHSKLTEVLMDYFVGDGRVVMIVNINPFDTGYDENSHVMKFSALAKEVYVTPAPAPTRRLPPSVVSQSPSKTKSRNPIGLEEGKTAPFMRKVTIGNERKMGQAVVEVLEEDEEDEHGEDDGDDEPINPLVDALFDEIEELRLKLFESEMRCVIVEAETREEVMKEMEERMRSMEQMFARRLMNEVEQNEMKTDAKIDLLHQSGIFGNSPMKRASPMKNVFSMEDTTLMPSNTNSDSEEIFAFESDEESRSDSSSRESLSPLADKGNAGKATRTSTSRQEILQFVPDGPEAILLPSDEDEMSEKSETDDSEDDCESVAGTEDSLTTNSEEAFEHDDDGGWMPAPERTPRPAKSKSQRYPERISSPSSPSTVAQGKIKGPAHSRVSTLAEEMNDLSLTSEDSIDLLSPKKWIAQQEISERDSADKPVQVKKRIRKQQS